MTFRIAELQEVLCACGRPRTGRKHELLGRALSLLKQSEGSSLFERLKIRIIDLYQQRFPNRTLPSSLSSGYSGTTTNSTNKTSSSGSSSYYGHHQSNHYSSSSSRGHEMTYPSLSKSGSQNYGIESNVSPNAMPIHPDVQFIRLPFYEVQDILIKPTSLGETDFNTWFSSFFCCPFRMFQILKYCLLL